MARNKGTIGIQGVGDYELIGLAATAQRKFFGMWRRNLAQNFGAVSATAVEVKQSPNQPSSQSYQRGRPILYKPTRGLFIRNAHTGTQSSRLPGRVRSVLLKWMNYVDHVCCFCTGTCS